MVNLEEQKNLEKIVVYLDKMNIPHVYQELGDEDGEIFPAISCTYQINDASFDVIIYNLGQWINVKCLIFEINELTQEQKLKVYKTCLELNYELPETTFSAYRENVYVEIDCLVDVDFDDFQGEFNSIAEGITAFVEIMQKETDIVLKTTKTGAFKRQ